MQHLSNSFEFRLSTRMEVGAVPIRKPPQHELVLRAAAVARCNNVYIERGSCS